MSKATIKDYPESKALTVFIISDSSGETAESVARAALVQFPPGSTSTYRLPQVRSLEQLKALITKVSVIPGLIAYTLVLTEYREALASWASQYAIPIVDLLGPLINCVSTMLSTNPLSQPGLSHVLDERYFRRIEAVDFAMRFDDGKNVDGISACDVVLIGVSRTSKTPNCMYLAHHYGIKAGNIPLVEGIEPPHVLYKIPSAKIIGLTIDPLLLQGIRLARSEVIGLAGKSDYAQPESITAEVRYARGIFRDLKCHVIDVSAKAIEETSSEIYLQLRQ